MRDLLRFEDTKLGPVYLDARFHFLLAPAELDGGMTTVSASASGEGVANLTVLGDVDEVAMAIENTVPGVRIHRIA